MRWALLVVLLGACAPVLEPPASEAQVTRIIDGDSLEVESGGGGIELRLQGVNAPEMDECMGPEAAARLTALTSDRALTLRTDGQDQFGRSLGDLRAGEESVAAMLVADGLAIAMSGDAELFRLQESAFDAGLGIWSESACGASGPRPRVVIVAMVANPDGADEDNLSAETITIANFDPLSVDLSGWTLRDESSANRFSVPSGTSLAAGASLTISSGCEISADVIAWCADGPVWNNGGDSALLLDASGRVVSFYRYEP